MAYLMKKLDLLVQNKITPIIIFDGAKLPMKQMEEEEREK